MNYYKQVAEMLGVELEEDFVVRHKGCVETVNSKLHFTENGLMENSSGCYCILIFLKILSGDDEIVKLPWKPKDGEIYWNCKNLSGNVSDDVWNDGFYDLRNWKSGNCFKTREEALAKGRKNIEQIRKEYEEA